jgi:tRNA pseudouridine13 synthase
MLESKYSVERDVGIEVYASSTPGIGGKIKEKPEDFTVEELTKLNLDEGNFTVVRIKKVNWDTLNLVRVIAKKLKISQRRIEYAGTKDKRSVSIQYFSIYGLSDEQIEKLKKIRIKDVEIDVLGKSKNRIGLGDLLGNRFDIIVRSAMDGDLIQRTLKELEERGCPNFFGLQRFGTMRFVTHKVGLEILRRNYKEAFWIYVAMPFKDENPEVRSIREELWECRNPVLGLREFPAYLRYERNLLQALREGKTEEQALLMLPKNLKLMFVHAYQSYIFNRTLSARLREFEDLKTIEKDDYTGFFHPDSGVMVVENDYYPVEWRMKRIALLRDLKRCALALPLPGYESRLKGWAKEVVEELLDNDGISLKDFRHEYKEFSSRGSYRLAEIPFSEFEFMEKDDFVKFRFTLPKGSYATVFLREFTKTCLL